MAKIAGVKVRTIEKWCSEKYRLNNRTYKKYATIDTLQNDLIIGSLLGDGHIDKRETQPNFIVSHAENQKDYLYWKYDILKNLCHSVPTRYESVETNIEGKNCVCQPYYRFNTRIINALIPYREMDILDLLLSLNNKSLVVFILDDGCRCISNWILCVAKFNEKERKLFCELCYKKFSLSCWVQKDNRYITFDSLSSRKIDELILGFIPNELDIVKYKITENYRAKNANYLYINNGKNKVGLSTYCRNTGWGKYSKIRNYMISNDIKELSIMELKSLLNTR